MTRDVFNISGAVHGTAIGQGNTVNNIHGSTSRDIEVAALFDEAKAYVQAMPADRPGRSELLARIDELDQDLQHGTSEEEARDKAGVIAQAAQLLGLAATATAVAEAVKRIFS